jgi:hypothetical protein
MLPLSHEQLRQAADQHYQLQEAQKRLERARWVLKQINDHVKKELVWKPSFRIHDGGYYGNNVTVEIPVVKAALEREEAK